MVTKYGGSTPAQFGGAPCEGSFVEVDECETQDGYELLKSFEADIFTTLQKPPSASAPPP